MVQREEDKKSGLKVVQTPKLKNKERVLILTLRELETYTGYKTKNILYACLTFSMYFFKNLILC